MAGTTQGAKRRKVVIIGAGFGGLTAARKLAGAPVEITLIDKHNHHLFQPLLYQVATAALSPADIAWPIRGILSGQRNIRIVLGDI
jgi:NADH dehydrogenase